MNVTGRNLIDDELAYERGGFSAALWGVLLACVIVILIGQMVGLDTSTVVGCAAAFGFGASAWLYHRSEGIPPRQRSEALSRVGGDLGFTFQAGASSDHVEGLAAATAGFSRHYRLDGKEEDAIRASFDPGDVNFCADHPGWHVICDGCTLAIWREEPGRDESTGHFRLTPQLHPVFVPPKSRVFKGG